MLGGYLNDVLDKMPGMGGYVAREVLKELVSSEATKRVLSYDGLVARIEAEEDELAGALAQLVDARLLRRGEVAGTITYEMAHEYLIGEIRNWIGQADLAFKQAEELLAREVANWRVHGTLIPRDRLKLLYAQRERFVGLDDEAYECLLRSALQAGFAVRDWAKVAGEFGEKFLLVALDASNAKISLGSAMVLGERGDSHAVEVLIAALQAEDGYARQVAAGVLGRTRNPRAVEPLIAAIQDESENIVVRVRMIDALGLIGDPRAVEPLISILQGYYSDVRTAAAVALGALGDPRAVESLTAALRDNRANVHRAAAGALKKIGTPEALAALEEWQRQQA